MRRLLSLVAVLLFASSVLFADITDSFTNSDGTGLDAHGNWTETTGVWTIESNKAQCAPFVDCTALRGEAAFPDDQFAQGVTKAISGEATAAGPVVRSVVSVYAVDNAGSADIAVYEGAVFKAQCVSGIASGTLFTLRATIAGSTVTVKVNGGSDIAGCTYASIAATSGKPGMRYNTNSTHPTIDDFLSTDATVSTGPPAGSLLSGMVGI